MKAKLLCGVFTLVLVIHFPFAQNANLSVQKEDQLTIGNKSAVMQTITLELRTKKGVSRQIMLGFSDFTSTENFDNGYDVRMFDYSPEDIYTYLDREKMVEQAYSSYNAQTRVPLAIHTTGYYKYEILAVDFDHIEKDTGVYLYDKYEDEYFNLRKGKSYQFSSTFGEITDRFEIFFKTNEKHTSDAKIYYNNTLNTLVVKGLESDYSSIDIFNTNGYAIRQFKNMPTQTLQEGISLSSVRSGVYIVGLTDNYGNNISRKLIID